MFFTIEAAKALFANARQGHGRKELEGWMEAKVREAIQRGDSSLTCTREQIPERFRHDDVHAALVTFQNQGFAVRGGPDQFTISGWEQNPPPERTMITMFTYCKNCSRPPPALDQGKE